MKAARPESSTRKEGQGSRKTRRESVYLTSKPTGRESGSHLKRFHAIHSLLHALCSPTNVCKRFWKCPVCTPRWERQRDRGRGQTLGHWRSKPWLPGPEKCFSLTDENKDSHGCSGKFLVLAVKKPTLVGRCPPTSWPHVSGRPLAGLSISFVPQAGPQVLTSVRIFPKFSRSTKSSFVLWNFVEGLVSCPWPVATHTHLLGWSKGRGLPTIPPPSSAPARRPWGDVGKMPWS